MAIRNVELNEDGSIKVIDTIVKQKIITMKDLQFNIYASDIGDREWRVSIAGYDVDVPVSIALPNNPERLENLLMEMVMTYINMVSETGDIV